MKYVVQGLFDGRWVDLATHPERELAEDDRALYIQGDPSPNARQGESRHGIVAGRPYRVVERSDP